MIISYYDVIRNILIALKVRHKQKVLKALLQIRHVEPSPIKEKSFFLVFTLKLKQN